MNESMEMLLLGAALGAILVTVFIALFVRLGGQRTSPRRASDAPAVEAGRALDALPAHAGQDRRIAETAGSAILVLDAGRRISWANGLAQRKLATDGAPLPGRDFAELIGIRADQRLPEEPVALRLGDELRYYAIAANEWIDDAGETCITVVLNDVTALTLAKAEAVAEQRRFRSLAENTNDMIVTIGADRIRRYVSSASERLLGYAPEEMIGESPMAGIHPDDRAHVMQVSESLLRGAASRIASYRYLHKDGHYVWLEASFRTIASPETGEPIEFVGTVRDISERHRDELEDAAHVARLVESNRLLAMAEALVHVGHWRVDLATGKLDWSDEVYRIHGVDQDYDLSLESAIEFYHEDDRAMVAEKVEHSIKTGEGFRFDARLVRPSGEVRYVASVGHAEVSPAGETIGLFGVFEDITDTVLSEMALRESRDEARAAMEAKATFLANMSHEIRTPMNGVIGFAEVLLESDLDDKPRDHVQVIVQSGQAMLRLLNELLDLSKIEAGQMTVSEEPVDIPHLVRGSLRLLQPVAREKGLEISAEIDPAFPQRVRGDSMRIRQVLLNLVGNALKFTDEGSVSVHARIVGERIEIAVRDTGIGILPERQQAIFEEFVQANSELASRRGGTGLGLSIARQLVHLMGGTISLESTPGEGSTFMVDLPLVVCSEGDLPVVEEAIPEPPGRSDIAGRRVLLAEDNEINQLLISAMGEKFDLRLDIARDGSEAVAMVRAESEGDDPYQLVLMDLQMPRVDGYAATRQLRAAGLTPGELPIVALTANAYPEDIKACLAAGMQAHLTKPLAMEVLQDALEKWLLRPRPEAKAEPVPETPLAAHPALPIELVEKYRTRRGSLIEALQRCSGAEMISPEDASSLAAKLHDMAGLAALFGEQHLGERARECEQLLRSADPENWRKAIERALRAVQ